MKMITSKQNEEIKQLVLLHDTKHRKKFGRFLAEGLRTIETIAQKLTPIQIYTTEAYISQNNIMVDKKLITITSPEVMNKISTSKTAPGIIAVFSIPPTPSVPLTKGIVLANISDPGNMGTLIRTAAAMNSNTVVVVDGVDPWHPKVIQATAGTIVFVTVFQLSWQELLQKKEDLMLCALTVTDGTSPSILTHHNILIVVGNEANGIPDAWLSDCSSRCTIKMPGKTESLNAAVAGSIALYLAFTTK